MPLMRGEYHNELSLVPDPVFHLDHTGNGPQTHWNNDMSGARNSDVKLLPTCKIQ